jgi:hypothetical protein
MYPKEIASKTVSAQTTLFCFDEWNGESVHCRRNYVSLFLSHDLHGLEQQILFEEKEPKASIN